MYYAGWVGLKGHKVRRLLEEMIEEREGLLLHRNKKYFIIVWPLYIKKNLTALTQIQYD